MKRLLHFVDLISNFISDTETFVLLDCKYPRWKTGSECIVFCVDLTRVKRDLIVTTVLFKFVGSSLVSKVSVFVGERGR